VLRSPKHGPNASDIRRKKSAPAVHKPPFSRCCVHAISIPDNKDAGPIRYIMKSLSQRFPTCGLQTTDIRRRKQHATESKCQQHYSDV